jgi:tRNA(Arg) A34 adenosine deaminase TadA
MNFKIKDYFEMIIDSIIIDRLIKKATKSNVNNKHSAGLIINNKIYSYGINRYLKNNQTIHAEINIFEKLKKHIKLLCGYDIIVIRINKNNILRNSRPCNNCIIKLKKFGIRRIFYSNNSGDVVYEYLNDMQFNHISSGNRWKIR